MSVYKRIGVGIVFCWFFFGGIGHFLQIDFFVSIVPPYIPSARTMVYLTGVLELLGALGVLFAATRRWAGIGLFLLTLCVTPANLHMWLHPDLYPDFSEAVLGIRLGIQVLFLACIWWATIWPVREPRV